MSDDPQDRAEHYDEDLTGNEPSVTSDQVEVDMPPERMRGVPHADADVADESLAERVEQEVPEVSPADIDLAHAEREILPEEDQR